jgi:hypothetical protein
MGVVRGSIPRESIFFASAPFCMYNADRMVLGSSEHECDGEGPSFWFAFFRIEQGDHIEHE